MDTPASNLQVMKIIWRARQMLRNHYGDVIMSAMASQITSLTIVYSTAYSDADQRKHQSSASLSFVRVIHRSPVNSPHKWPVTRKMFPFDDVIMDVHPNLVLYSNLAESCSSSYRISISIVKSFWEFARSTAVILPCYVQTILTNKQ